MKRKTSSREQRIAPAREPGELVELLTSTGKDLQLELKRRILDLGPAAVEPLCAVLEDEHLQCEEAPGQGWAPIHAARLLVELRAGEAIPSLLRCLRELEPMHILYSELTRGLQRFGEEAVEPIFEELEATSTRDDRLAFGEVLAGLGVRDERIYRELLQCLAIEPSLGACFLADYGDPRALGPLRRAFDAFELEEAEDRLLANQDLIELRAAIESLGGELTEEQEAKFARAIDERRRLQLRRFAPASDEQGKERGAGRSGKKRGRNDPCWCGSGKKYKKCHLREDKRA